MNSFSKTTLFLLFVLFAQKTLAQIDNAKTIFLTLKVTDHKNIVIPFATVEIYKGSDTLNGIKKVADSLGRVRFKLDGKNFYTIRTSAVGYVNEEKGIATQVNNMNMIITLQQYNQSLNEVVVTSKKPLMRQEEDKTIVDPTNIAASSTDAYETLEKVPGIFIDQDGNIYLNSSTPAQVLINGRELRMSAEDVATILKSMPPTAIEKIEILRTPSTKYDAASSGGLVNVVLKKGFKIGFTGSVTAALQQGRFGNRTIGFNLSNNNGITNTYLNVQYGNRNNYEDLSSDRIVSVDTTLRQNAYTVYHSNAVYAAYGINTAFNKKSEFNYDGRITNNWFNNNSDNQSNIFKKINGAVVTDNFNELTNKGNSFNINQDLGLKIKLDSTGGEWVNKVSYSYSKSNTDQNYFTNVKLPSVYNESGYGNFTGERNFIVLQTDFTKKLNPKLTLETGAKSTFTIFNNNAEYFITQAGVTLPDEFRTNRFRYTENINAAYLQMAQTLGTIVIKGGVRMENTNMNGRQKIPSDTNFKINRTDFFPYVYLRRNIMKIAGYDIAGYLIYRKSITRPGYDMLNPFAKYIDPFLYETGNPMLKPQFTQTYEANISVDDFPLFAIGVNNTKDIFSNVTYQSDADKSIAFRTYDNLGTNKEFYFRFAGGIPPGGAYFFWAGGEYRHNTYEGIYEKQPINFKQGSWTIYSYQELKIDKRSVFTLNAWMMIDGLFQFYELKNFGAVHASINRKFLNNKLTVTLSVRDIFFTNKSNFTFNQGSISATGLRFNDSRRFGINIRYNFGRKNKEENFTIPNAKPEEN